MGNGKANLMLRLVCNANVLIETVRQSFIF